MSHPATGGAAALSATYNIAYIAHVPLEDESLDLAIFSLSLMGANATDYVREFADQIRELVPLRYTVLGTDGFGRSDSRKNLRRFFEVNRFYVTVAALKALADDGELPAAKVAEAIKKYEIDAEKPAPWTV